MDDHSGFPLESVVIRRGERSDVDSIHRIESTVFDQPWSPSMFEQFLGDSVFLVAEYPGGDGTERGDEWIRSIAGEIVGYVVADVVATVDGTFGHIKDLAVHPTAQGNGLGRVLLQRAVFGLTIASAERIKLEVRRSNERAISLYRSEGFEAIRLRPGYYDDGESALVMVNEP